MSTETNTKSPSKRHFMSLAGSLFAAPALLGTYADAGAATPGTAAAQPDAGLAVRYKTATVDGVDIFYREAGKAGNPVVLLLHGFPTSSRMYRNLIPMLADRYHVIAPDYPAFGHSAVPSREVFKYTHAHISEVMEHLLDQLGIRRFALYLMDFGGPIGYRLMLKYPERVPGVIVQNTPVFSEPTDGPAWKSLRAYWKDNSPANRDAVRSMLTPDATRDQYVTGTLDPSLLDPDDWTIDSALLSRPGVDEIMLDLLYDIHNNQQTVADAARFFRAHQSKLMIATGANDALFPGASMKPPPAMPGIEFHAIDSGHFALEDRCAQIGQLTRDFLARVMPA